MTRAPQWLLSLALIFSLIPTVACAGLNNWTVQGPPGGYFRQVAVNPTDNRIMYATYSRSVHKSTDGGDTWQTIREFRNQINSIVVAPDDGKVYLGVNAEGVFRSDDQGSSYVQIAPGSFSGPWGVALSGSTVYYSNAGSFYRSIDRGVSWMLRTNPPQSLPVLLADPLNADSIFGFSGPYLVRSVDGGATWSQTTVTANFASVIDVVLLSSTSLVACASDGFYLSRNAGATWTRNATGNGCVGIAADRNSVGTLLAGVGSNQSGLLYRSLNDGDSWNFVGTIPNGPANGILFGPGSPASYVVVNGQGAMRSTNSGVNWTEVTQGPIASTASLATTSATNSKIYAYALGMTNGSAALYSNSGASNAWQRLNLNAAQALGGFPFGGGTLAVKPGDPETIYLGAFSIGLYRSTNGGAAWQAIGAGLSGFGINAFAFDPVDPATMYAKVSFGGNTPANGLYRSIDGGMSWSPRSATLPQDAFGLALIVDRSNPSHLLLGAYQGFGAAGTGGLYQSIDGGINWTQMFVGQDVRSIAQDPVETNRFYVAASSGLQVSQDGGTSFNANNQFSIITSQPAGLVVVDPVVPTTLYASSFDPNNSSSVPQKYAYVLRSVDRGATWETLRRESDPGFWAISQLILEPTTPSILYANVELHGVATFEVAPDLALTLSGHSGTKPLGAQSSFDVRVENRGPYAATAVRIATPIPASLTGVSATTDRGSCNVANNNVQCNVSVLPNGDSVNVHVIYTAPTAVQISITPSATAHERDSVTANNSASASVIVGEVADLGITLVPSVAVATQGTNVTYTLTVTNNGPSTATDASVTLVPGGNITIGSLPSDCSTAGATLACRVGSLSVGATRVYSIPASLNASGPWILSASVSPTASASDPVSSNDNVQATINNSPPPPPPSSGGGGSSSLEWMALLTLIEVARRRRNPTTPIGRQPGI